MSNSKIDQVSNSNFFNKVGVLQKINSFLTRVFNLPKDEPSIEGKLEELIDLQAESDVGIDEEQRTLIENIIYLRDKTIADVMVPRADIVAIEIESMLDDLIKLINKEAHSRVPVFQKSLDDVVGMVHIKDIISEQKSNKLFNLGDIVRPVLFVAPSMHVLELLLEMRAKRTHMALVVDEFGGVDGLLTIEDLVEEIVGEIEDEHDINEEPVWQKMVDGSINADARLEISTFEAQFDQFVTEEERLEIDTLGGLVFSLAGRVPLRGELVKHSSGVEIEILEADPRRIRKLRIYLVGNKEKNPNVS